ncbi:MAG: RecX family transcriptional regulator [Prevotella sp.]|nr:RecX family transcriptional regulator [Prevotella sp.]
MTEEQILSKLTTFCARGEHCMADVHRKLDLWKIEDETLRKKVCRYLLDEKYIDEERYARAFIHDKMQYNKWGRRKVEQALYMKRIPRGVYEPLFDEVGDNNYEEILRPLLRDKARSIKASSDYERRMKLIRFALQRGFSYEQAEHCLSEKNK